MPEVRASQYNRGKPKRGKAHPGRDAAVKKTADASSILLGAVFLIAVIVGTAAWMGRSMSVVERRFDLMTDGFVRSVGLSVQTIRVIGASPEQEARIRKAIEIHPGSNMFRADPHDLKEKVEKLSRIADVQVHRLWPGHIDIFVLQTEAAMILQKDGEFALVDTAGRTIEAEMPKNASLPVIVGEGGQDTASDLFVDLSGYPSIATRIDRAIWVGERRWDLRTIHGADVMLPSGDDHTDALDKLVSLQREYGVLDRRLAKIDLRDPERAYIRNRSTQTASISEGRG